MNQYLALVEETTRSIDPGSGYHFLPLRGQLQPKFEPNDAPRKEFRGQATPLGDASVRRLSSAWSHTLEANAYPGAETGLLLKHLLGNAGTRALVDTSAYRGLVRPVPMPYGLGQPLADKAIGLIPNTDEAGTTLRQYFGGGRPRSLELAIRPDDDVVLTVEMGGAGPWVGAPDQAALAGVAFPVATPFLYSDAKFYIGAGISRTGSAPDFTAIAPGTMAPFQPDEATLKITSGIEDKIALNGINGPSKTHRSGQMQVELDFTIDYADPSSGFSSADEFKTTFSGPRTNSLLIVLETSELAGAAEAKYAWVFDLPLMLLKAEPPERNTEGQTPQVKMTWTGLLNSAVGYPVAILTTDKAEAY